MGEAESCWRAVHSKGLLGILEEYKTKTLIACGIQAPIPSGSRHRLSPTHDLVAGQAIQQAASVQNKNTLS